MPGVELVPLHYPATMPRAARIRTKDGSSKEFCEYIKSLGIDQAEIICEDLGMLKNLPFIKHLRIRQSSLAADNFDFSPLYEMPELLSLSCLTVYGPQERYAGFIDYSQINGLTDVFVKVNKWTLNFNKVSSLKSLRITGFKGKNRDLTDMFCSKELDTLQIIQCGVQSLKGIDTSQKMQCVYLSNNRNLQDISDLKSVKNTLRALRIVNCPKIWDFSVLRELENLELLELSGTNTLPNLDFIYDLPNLETFICHMNILDGDLTPCLDLSYAYCGSNRRHYNLKSDDLPRGYCYRGNENIEEWRRLE